MPVQNPLKSLWQGHLCRDDGTSWQGVLCYYNRVAAVNLDGMNLTGEASESASGALQQPEQCSQLSLHQCMA